MTANIQPFDYSVDIMQALLWQYNEASNIQELLQLKQNWYNQNQATFWQSFYTDIFDLRTANDFGLAIWSILLGVNLSVPVSAATSAVPSWGFGANHNRFAQGNFHRDIAGTIVLNTQQKRLVLQLRYYQLVARGAVTEINALLQRVFGSQGKAYVLDGLNMTMTYIFTFTPSSQLQFILQQFDILPRPAGVQVNYVINVKNAFGFDPPHVNYDRGNFKS